uniref:Uncharacterized protein n=1 Tax=Scleropages formosus TaxID=113540 RepID=A0A8C9RWB0_SCLFO
QRHGLGLLRLGRQHGVAAQHHRLVLQLVPVDPGEDAGQARVRHAVRDAVQQVEVAGPAGCGGAVGWTTVLLSGGSGVRVPLGVPCDGLASRPGCVPSPSGLTPSVAG